MVDFIFLGIIPGTHLQVTFGTWLYCTGIMLVISGLHYLVANRRMLFRLRNYTALLLAVRQFSRQALPA